MTEYIRADGPTHGDAFVAAESAAGDGSHSHYLTRAYILDPSSSPRTRAEVVEDQVLIALGGHTTHLEGDAGGDHRCRADMSRASKLGMREGHKACLWDAHIAAMGSSTSRTDRARAVERPLRYLK